MESMIERVARALFAAENGERTIGECVVLARAAIEAMREPTEEMHDKVEDMLDSEGWSMDCAINDVWRIMIDAALSETAP